MKAIVHSQYGNPEVLHVTTLERPVPKKNEVLIRVKAAGLDYGQWHLMFGKPYAMRLATGLTKPKRLVLGMDVSASWRPSAPSVCVIGAGGGVGSWAVQLVRHLGARVTAVCGTSKAPVATTYRPPFDAAGHSPGTCVRVRPAALGRRDRESEGLFRVGSTNSSPTRAAIDEP